MIPEIKELLERAKLSQKAAENLLRDGFANFSASRAYYAIMPCFTLHRRSCYPRV
jgi:uncharacterized protein (UPF0332 family)